MARLILPPVTAALLLAGCAAVPNLGPAPQVRPAQAYAATESFQAPAAEWPADAWWKAYGDAQLDTLVDEALAGSPTLAQAQARLRAAQARAQQSRAALLPSLSLNAQAAENKQSYNNGIPPAFTPQGYNDTGRASLDLSFDLDLWGKNRAALAAATSEATAAEMDAVQARLAAALALVVEPAMAPGAFALPLKGRVDGLRRVLLALDPNLFVGGVLRERDIQTLAGLELCDGAVTGRFWAEHREGRDVCRERIAR